MQEIPDRHIFYHQQEQQNRFFLTGFIWSLGFEGDVLAGKYCSPKKGDKGSTDNSALVAAAAIVKISK